MEGGLGDALNLGKVRQREKRFHIPKCLFSNNDV